MSCRSTAPLTDVEQALCRDLGYSPRARLAVLGFAAWRSMYDGLVVLGVAFGGHGLGDGGQPGSTMPRRPATP